MRHEFKYDGVDVYTISSTEYDVDSDTVLETQYTLDCATMTLDYDGQRYLLDDVPRDSLSAHSDVYQWLYKALVAGMIPSPATEVTQYTVDHIDEAERDGDTLRWPNGLQLELYESRYDPTLVELRYARAGVGIVFDSIKLDYGATVDQALAELFPARFRCLAGDTKAKALKELDQLIKTREGELNDIKARRAAMGE